MGSEDSPRGAVRGLKWEQESRCTPDSFMEVRWVSGSYLVGQGSFSPGPLARIHSRWLQSFLLLPAEWEKWIGLSPGCKLKACNWGRWLCPGKVPSSLEQPLDKQRLSSSASSELASTSLELLAVSK